MSFRKEIVPTAVTADPAVLSMLFDAMPIACITMARDLTITSWNPAAEHIFGFSADEAIGQPFTVVLSDAVTPDIAALMQQNVSGERIVTHSVNENRAKDGRTLLCRWRNTSLVDANGVVFGVLSMAEDVTEERKAREELMHTQARHRQLLEQLPHFVFSIDPEDRYTAMNASACAFFGRPESEIIGKTAIDLGIDLGEARPWTDQNAKTRETGETQTMDSSATFNGRVHWYRSITSPIRDPHGTIIGVNGVSIDMTDLKTAEATAHRLLHAVEQLDEVVFITDREGTITYVNPAFERVYGFTAAEAIGKTPRILKSSETPPERFVALWDELLAGRSVRMELRNQRKDGEVVDIIGSASPVSDEKGIGGFITVQQDATALKRAAEDRRRLDERMGQLARMEALGTLAGGIAHDFNNILAIILTHTTVIERRHTDPSLLARSVDVVRQAVRRGSLLARQILTFASRAELKPDFVDLQPLIVDLGLMITETFPRTISLRLEVDPHLPLVRGDASQLRQALLNLCVNARDAMQDGGELTIRAHRKSHLEVRAHFPDACGSDYVVVSVGDTGTGIAEEARRHIFEPFFSTKPRGKGTGLGLALVFGVVNTHGGLIDVESSIGKGTTFRMCLPLEERDARDAATQKKKQSGIESILVIDDETALLESLATQLSSHDYRVTTAENGVDALERLRAAERLPDAVIMDLGMPKMSATELLRELRNLSPTMRIVAMTGYVDSAVHASVLAAGVEKIVAKPFEIDELLTALRESS